MPKLKKQSYAQRQAKARETRRAERQQETSEERETRLSKQRQYVAKMREQEKQENDAGQELCRWKESACFNSFI